MFSLLWNACNSLEISELFIYLKLSKFNAITNFLREKIVSFLLQ